MENFNTDQIRDWLLEEISTITGTENKLLDPSRSLSQNGISSMGFVELLLGISRKFNVEMLNSDISSEDVASVNAFAAKIARTGNLN
jgi:acyl carrier protein